MKSSMDKNIKTKAKDIANIDSGYKLKLTSIGSNSWQLFITKIDDSSDYVRLVYGVTEQVGGGPRAFKILRSYIIVPQASYDSVFILQFNEYQMKNRRVWVALETVRRNKGKKGISVGTFVALSPMKSKWFTTIGSDTPLVIKPLDFAQFNTLYKNSDQLDTGFAALLEE